VRNAQQFRFKYFIEHPSKSVSKRVFIQYQQKYVKKSDRYIFTSSFPSPSLPTVWSSVTTVLDFHLTRSQSRPNTYFLFFLVLSFLLHAFRLIISLFLPFYSLKQARAITIYPLAFSLLLNPLLYYLLYTHFLFFVFSNDSTRPPLNSHLYYARPPYYLPIY